MKEICIISPRFYPLVGGAENQAFEIAKGLVKKGYSVTVFSNYLKSYSKKETYEKIKIIRLKTFIKNDNTKINSSLNIFFFNLILIFHLLKPRRSRLVFYFWGIDLFGISAFYLKLIGTRTYIRTATPSANEIGGNYKNIKFFCLRKFLIKTFYRYVAISTEIKQNYLANNIQLHKIISIFNCVNENIFFPIEHNQKLSLKKDLSLNNEDTIYLLFCGHFYKTKGLDFLIDSVIELDKVLENKKVELLVLGSSNFIDKSSSVEKNVIHKIKTNSLKRTSIRFLGQVSNQYKYFQIADIFILSSKSEGLPNVLLEAMACGIPCISTNVGGVPDIISPNKNNGLLIEYGDIDHLNKSILKLITDKNLYKTISINARKTIESDFSSEVIINKYISIFNGN
jgi:glycosyltransferase involved in cell wall biosynthesis